MGYFERESSLFILIIIRSDVEMFEINQKYKKTKILFKIEK